MRIARGEEFDDERFALFDLDSDFLTGPQTIEKCGSRQPTDVGICLAKFIVFQEDVRIEQVAQQIVASNRMSDFLFERLLLVSQIGRRKVITGQATHWRRAAKNDLLQFLRPATGGHAEYAGKHLDDGIGKREIVVL